MSAVPAPEVTETRLLDGRVVTYQPATGYRTAIDAVLLAACVPVRTGEHALELGTGVGAAAFCLAARVPDVSVTALELQPALAALADRGVEANGLAGRVRVVTGDLLAPPDEIAGPYDHVFFNPPYAAAGTSNVPPDPVKAAATVEGAAKLKDWIGFAAERLGIGGSVTVVHRADRMGEVTAAMKAAGIGAREVLELLPKAGRAAKRAIARGRKGTAETAGVASHPPLVLHAGDGAYTEAAEKILRGGESLL